jgi:hypothetical protein
MREILNIQSRDIRFILDTCCIKSANSHPAAGVGAEPFQHKEIAVVKIKSPAGKKQMVPQIVMSQSGILVSR